LHSPFVESCSGSWSGRDVAGADTDWKSHNKTGDTVMIDWDSETWGGGVTLADNGSWVGDKHTDDASIEE
jgi:hypothetical protein